jgi:hypothetical protein
MFDYRVLPSLLRHSIYVVVNYKYYTVEEFHVDQVVFGAQTV